MRYMVLVMTLLFFSQVQAKSELRVDFDEAQINLSTKPESNWNFMDVNLYLRGEGVKQLQWVYKPSFSRVETDQGPVPARNSSRDDSYPRIWRVDYLSDNDRKNSKHRFWQRTGVPPRSARTLFVEGYTEAYVGAPGDVIEIDNYLDKSGSTIQHKLLQKYGIELSFMTKDDLIDMQEKIKAEKQKARKEKREIEDMGAALGNAFSEIFVEAFKGAFGFGGHSDLTIMASDKQGRLLNVELYNDQGERMEVQSRSFSHSKEKGTINMGLSYKRMLPHRGKLRIYIDNGNNLVKVPFKHSVQLP